MSERSIFLEAVEIGDPSERAAYLDATCAGDAALRRRVEELLGDHEQPDEFMRQPAPAVVTTLDSPAASEAPGAVVAGRYKLLERIGEGGMGEVWVADQLEPIRRRVALKLIKPGMDSRAVLARFEAERQALALMDHPNIARVLDAGATDAGRPYFVMELVKGVPITRFCDERKLTPRERLELFLPVCHAIQHAHQKGIIHRDIKPTNVLVALYDGKPVPKVIDFGVAKAAGQPLTEKTLVTGLGAVVGTPEYMSPEQAELNQLDIDTRSDIYSLGVLLYELLTGTTPLTRKRLKDAALLEVLRVIREEEPPRPSTRLSTTDELPSIAASRGTEPARLSRLVRGELDWVVMKALEKDRGRRYETANGFAADVQRYLAGEAVLAVPPSASYRLRKFARRNSRALAIAVVLGMALLVTVGAVAGSLGWAARDRATRQAAVEQEASRALHEAEQWMEKGKWPEALSAAKRAEGLLAGGGGEELRERVRQLRKDLEMVLRLEDIRVLSREYKQYEWDHASTDRAYAQAFADHGIDVPGLPVDEAAARVRARAGIVVPLAVALDDWAGARSANDPAGPSHLTAVAQAADPDTWRRQVRQAVRQKDAKALEALAASPDCLRQPPTSLATLAGAFRALGRTEPEVAVLRQAQRQHPGDFWINLELASTLHTVGPPHLDEAVSFYRAALAVRPQSTPVLGNLGVVLYDLKKLDEAMACYRRAIDIDPKSAYAHNNLGNALASQRKLDEAVVYFRKAIEIDPKYASPYYNLGLALKQQNKLDDAIAFYKKAVEIDPRFAPPYYGLGVAHSDQMKLDEAIAWFRKAIENDKTNASAHFALGLALAKKGFTDKAVAAFRDALQLKPDHANAREALAVCLDRQAVALAGHPLPGNRDPGRAVKLAKEAVELTPKDARRWTTLGAAHYRAGEWEEAVAALMKYRELRKDDAEWSNPFFLAMAHWRLGAGDEARKWYDLGAAWMDKNQPRNEGLRRVRTEAEDLLGVGRRVEVAPPPRQKK